MMKAAWLAEKPRLSNRSPDWTMSHLHGPVHSEYMRRHKLQLTGVTPNCYAADMVTRTVDRAQLIPDSQIQIHSRDISVFSSQSSPGLSYQVTWQQCQCVFAMQGNVCKHSVRLMLHTTTVHPQYIINLLGYKLGSCAGGYAALLPLLQGTVPAPKPQPCPSRRCS